ncbi:MAG: hypothetical protein IT323_14430 [Anaerolineae bacterium]|nr:hypothetical protein [Anaerolineae bacterium]
MNDNTLHRFRRPVQHQDAPDYVLWLLVSLGATVVGTRFFLEITGYPQIGNATFHIAHALWGGLFLVLAALITLIFASRWTNSIAAVMAGVGTGLFIDEVGKFITRDLNYFFPLAAPIIYIAFLLIVFVYVFTYRNRVRGPRAEMYGVLEDLQEILDSDLSEMERDALIVRLESIRTEAAPSRPDLAHLAEALGEALRSPEVPLTPHIETPVERLIRRILALEARWFPPPVLHRLALIGVIVLFFASAARAVVLVIALVDPAARDSFVLRLVEQEGVTGALSLFSYASMLALDLITSVLLALSFVHFLRGRTVTAIRAGTLALVVSLALTNVLAFYFNQFSVVALAMVQLLVLLGLRRLLARL